MNADELETNQLLNNINEIILHDINNPVHINIDNIDNIANIDNINNIVLVNNTIIKKISYVIIIIFKILIYLVMIIYPFMEIAYSGYMDNSCNMYFIAINDWTFGHGVMGIITCGLFGGYMTGIHGIRIQDMKLFVIISGLFNYCWIIVGSSIYLQNCRHIEQNIFDYFMKITLGIVFLVLTYTIITKFKYIDSSR
jgi:hypothetical protein